MAAPGQFKSPRMSVHEAYECAMAMIENSDADVAIFMVAGQITSSKSQSESFNTRINRLQKNLIGVYGWYVDHRYVLDDIKEFYRMTQPATKGD